MLANYQVFLQRRVDKKEIPSKESRCIAGIFDVIAAGLQVAMCDAE